MYSEQLEALIKSIIADGKITDKERAVLHKRAEAEGIDADEIDVYIDGLLCPTPPTIFNRIRAEKGIYDLYRKTYCFHVDNNDEGIHFKICYFTEYETKNKQLYFLVHTNKYSDACYWGNDIKRLNFTIKEYGQVILVKKDIKDPIDYDDIKISGSFVIESENLFLLCQESNIHFDILIHYGFEKGGDVIWQDEIINVPLPSSFISFLQKFYKEERLEALIKSIIADGKITDKERAVLHKRAEAEGIDADEIDVYIEGRLTELRGLIREHPLNLFTKEIYRNSECYKFKKNYRFDYYDDDEKETAYIQFVHLIEWDDISQKKQKKYDGIALFIATDGYVSMSDDHTLSFSSPGKKNIRVTRNYDFFSKWEVPETQEFDGEELDNIGFGIDKEQIKALCDATNLSISVNHSVIPKTKIIGFEYLAQRFYKENFDSTAYPNCEEREEAANAAANAARLTKAKEEEKRRKQKESSSKNKKVIGCLVFIILLIICFIIAIFG